MRTAIAVSVAVSFATLAPSAAAQPSDAEPAAAESLGVDDAVAATLAAQPRLRAAEAQRRAAAARAEQAAWRHVGSLETVGLVTPLQRPLAVDFPGIPDLLPPLSFEVKQLRTYALSATLTQPLFSWGAISSGRAAAQRELTSSGDELARVRQQLTFEARQAFYQAATAVSAVDVARAALEQQQAFLRATRSRMEAGAAAKLDVLKAELTVAQAESALLASRNGETLAREALASVTLDPRFREARLAEAKAAGAAVLPAATEAVARALAGRPDLQSLRHGAEALGMSARAIKAASLPALGLRASWTQQNDELGDVFAKSGQVYQVSLALDWDATEALRSRPRVAELRAQRSAVLESLRAAETGVALDVRSAISTATEAEQQLQVAERALATAEEQARVARLAYGEGAISALEARDADLGLTSARFTLLRARLDLALAQARLSFAIGD